MRRSMHGLVVLAALGFAACDSIDVVYTHEAGDIIGGDQWLKGTHVVNGYLTVTSGVLEVAACSTIEMAPGAGIDVRDGGALKFLGTADCPITITSAKASPGAGDWDEINLYWDSMESQFDNVVFEYGGSAGEWGMLWVDDGAQARVTNSTFQYGGGYGVDVESTGELTAFSGNTLTDNALGPVRVFPDGAGMLDAGTYYPNGVDAITVQGGTATTSATWHNLGVPFTLDGWLTIEADVGSALIDVDAGTVIMMAPGTGIDVDTNGGLALNGNAAEHVVITSEKAYPSAGDWAEIDIRASSVGAYNSFAYTDIEWGGNNVYGQIWLDYGAGLSLDNVTFTGAGGGCDIYFADEFESAAFSSTNTLYDRCIW